METQQPPVRRQQLYMLGDVDDVMTILDRMTQCVVIMKDRWVSSSTTQRVQRMHMLLRELGIGGVLALFGMRRTYKSIAALPPRYSVCMY